MRRGEIREVVILYGEGCGVEPVEEGGGDVDVDDQAEDVVCYLDEGTGGECGIYVYFLKRERHDGAEKRCKNHDGEE